MLERRVVASIDLHNNSGRNPHYACICSLNAEHLQLAGLFSDRVLYFQRPKGVQTQAFTPFCPSITCECGPIGDASGVQAAVSLLNRMLALDESSDFRAQMPGVHPAVELYHTIATLRVPPAATLSFSSRGDTDLFLRPDLDRLNFLELPPGTELGVASRALHECVEVCDQAGRDVTDDFLYLQDDALCVKRAVLPSMFTTSIEAIRQDCVGYFMERMTIPARTGGL
ncbi:MAG: hypothetical protein IT423_13645 [Pirellulaceae bacterium]|nr:hypothetical protein [Pirellulaceae bacterium]